MEISEELTAFLNASPEGKSGFPEDVEDAWRTNGRSALVGLLSESDPPGMLRVTSHGIEAVSSGDGGLAPL